MPTAGPNVVFRTRHRSDDDEPYVYVTENYGETWKSFARQSADGIDAGFT